jgi:hypothetical protein
VHTQQQPLQPPLNTARAKGKKREPKEREKKKKKKKKLTANNRASDYKPTE